MESLAVVNVKNSVSCSVRMANVYAEVVRYFAYCFFYFFYFYGFLKSIPEGTKHGFAA